jgi:hypothetical protein
MVPFLTVGWRLELMHGEVAGIQGGGEPPDAASLAGCIPTFKEYEEGRADFSSDLPAQAQAQRQKLLLAGGQDALVLFTLQTLAQINMIQD